LVVVVVVIGGGGGGGGGGGSLSITCVTITLFNTTAALACRLPVTCSSICTSMLLFILQDADENEQFAVDEVRTINQTYGHGHSVLRTHS
jgi:hypothetical protein